MEYSHNELYPAHGQTPNAPEPKAEGRWLTPPRIIGLVMCVIAFIGSVWCLAQYPGELEKLKQLPSNVDPSKHFPNVFNLTGNTTYLIFFACMAGLFFGLGLYRVIKGHKSRGLIFILFFVFFGIAIANAFYINSIRQGVYDELIPAQHTWAEQRYGIQYDDVSILETKNRKNQTHKEQDKVYSNGDVIASVCYPTDETIAFCDPETSLELYVLTP